MRAVTACALAGLIAALIAALVTSGQATAAERPTRPAKQRGKSVQKAPAPRKAAASTAPVATDYLQRAEVLDYIDELVATRQFDRATLLRIFADVRYSATAVRLMTPSGGGVRRDWNAYRARFVEPVRLAAGYRFWEDNATLLERAERDFGVPPEIVVGILGVETVYGRNTGGFRVIDALATLAFDYPRDPVDAQRTRQRAAFFRDQLTDALLLARDGGVELATLKGSYAGAVGMPQFMPGSIRSYAIDYDGDGRIDLVDSPADIVGSVANFLARHGWVRGLPTVLPLDRAARLDPAQMAGLAAMVDAGSVPSLRYADLAAAGLSTSATVVEPLALIDLPSGSDAAGQPLTAYLAGTQNFHVITRYNRSYFYAYSVIELGSTIRALRDVRP